MAHDFVNFPELTDTQMQFYYMDSPHKQIISSFEADCVKVHDGDTITVRWDERDFDFPIRFINIAAPELNESGGIEARDWLAEEILNQKVYIKVNPHNRVDKWGRLLGNVIFRGMDMGELECMVGLATQWERRNETKMPDIGKELDKVWS